MNESRATEYLDALLQPLEFPVRSQTLERAWNLMGDDLREILVIVRFQAAPGRMDALERAAQVFVEAARHLEGGIFSALYRSPDEASSLTLVERFADQAALDRHMQTDYFRQFQMAQAPLLTRPAEATVLRRLPVDFEE